MHILSFYDFYGQSYDMERSWEGIFEMHNDCTFEGMVIGQHTRIFSNYDYLEPTPIIDMYVTGIIVEQKGIIMQLFNNVDHYPVSYFGISNNGKIVGSCEPVTKTRSGFINGNFEMWIEKTDISLEEQDKLREKINTFKKDSNDTLSKIEDFKKNLNDLVKDFLNDLDEFNKRTGRFRFCFREDRTIKNMEEL